MPRNQRALKAQKFIAWGNAPGIVPRWAMRAVGAKVAVGVTTAGLPVTVAIFICIMLVLALFPSITPTATFIERRLRLGHPSKLMTLGLHFFYIKQAAPRPSEQAHGARLALLLRLQRDNSLMVVYLGRCPRL